MTLSRLIRRTIHEWQSWCAEKRLARAIPGFRANRERLRQLKRSHKNTQPAIRELRESVTAALQSRERV